MFPSTIANPRTLPESIRQLLYLPTTGPGQRESFCIICHEEIRHDEPSATHQCCGTTLCRKCFLNYVLQNTWDSKTNASFVADCPYCKRPILRPHPYAQDEIVMVTTRIDLVRQGVGDHVFYSKPLNSREQGDLLSDEQAMMLLDPEGKHPRAQQLYEEMKSHSAAGWRLFCFEEANPSTFLVAEGWKTSEQYASDTSNIHPALRPQITADEAQSANGISAGDIGRSYDSNSAAHDTHQAQCSPQSKAKRGKLRRLWHTAIQPARVGMKAEGWRLAYAGGC